jgi:uncharacterized protein YndB with AHSA1/START domain
MDKPKVVYVTYINSTPEKVWNALIDSEMTKLYWGHSRNISTWEVGSAWRHEDYANPSLVDVVGKVVESTPPKRLVLTWGKPADAENPAKQSRVSFDLEPFFDAVRLTVTHDEFEPGFDITAISQGWPGIFSSLKTLLETGRPMSMTTRRWAGPPR